MEEERADTGGEERSRGVKADEQRYEHRSTEGYEEVLHAHDPLTHGAEARSAWIHAMMMRWGYARKSTANPSIPSTPLALSLPPVRRGYLRC